MTTGHAEVRSSGLTRSIILGALACIAFACLLGSLSHREHTRAATCVAHELRAEHASARPETAAPQLEANDGSPRSDELRAVESEDSEHDASLGQLSSGPVEVARQLSSHGSDVVQRRCAAWSQQHAIAAVQARGPPARADASMSADQGSV